MEATADFSTFNIQKTFAELNSSEAGLTKEEAENRLKQFGLNEIPATKGRSVFFIFIKQFKSLLVGVLLMAGLLSWFTGHLIDMYIILSVVLIDALIGFVQEWRAERAVTALHRMLTPAISVLRSGKREVVSATRLVPGDIIILTEGDFVPADARVIESKNMRTIEAALTGESLPVNKTKETLPETASMGDKKNMLWKSTFVTSGYGHAVITGTGLNTAIGQIANTLASIPVERSHFQKKIDKLATQMGAASVAASILLFILGYFTLNLSINELFLVCVAAMVSIIPEGLPSVIVIVLTIGSYRMTKRNAIVREFTATETLGAVTTIITDKTGTLTENALTVKKIFLVNEPEIHITGEGLLPIGSFMQDAVVIEPLNNAVLKKLLTISGFCNNALLHHKSGPNAYELSGDPTEGALLVLARKGGIDTSSASIKKIDDFPFNSSLKLRAALFKDGSDHDLFVAGAPEIVLRKCTHVLTKQGIIPLDSTIKSIIQEKINAWSMDAMRVIALAYKKSNNYVIRESDIEQLVFAAVVGMIDPPREEVKAAVQQCRQAGIRVIMATGDHISTAVAISKATGIIDTTSSNKEILALSEEQLMVLDDDEFDEAVKKVNVFARLNPDTKLRIAGRLQAMGELIAMTGDGVNDAPALKKADVGIAMGMMGTDVARDSAKVVLADDNFATIVSAIEEGRIVFMNARQASFYLISSNLAEISTLLVAIIAGLPMPLTAVQILWLNLVTDGIGDMALAAERGHGEALKQKPLQKEERILNKSILPFLFINAIIMVVLSIGAYFNFIAEGVQQARSGVFIVMSFTQLFNLYNMRSMTRSVFNIGLFSNPYVTLTMASSSLITIVITEVPFFKNIFGFGALSTAEFLSLVLLSSLVLVSGEFYKYFKSAV